MNVVFYFKTSLISPSKSFTSPSALDSAKEAASWTNPHNIEDQLSKVTVDDVELSADEMIEVQKIIDARQILKKMMANFSVTNK